MPIDPARYSLTFACYNALDYTRQCVDSMLRHGTPLDRLVVIDNGSSDGTRDYLATLPLGGLVLNRGNLGCGIAWNQGILAQQSEWTIVMNNDVLVAPQWIEKLIATAERIGVRIISPALVEGPLDYDFEAFEQQACVRMRDVHRRGDRHAVCLAVHWSVWEEIGLFRPAPRLLGYEDTIFFHEARLAGIPTAVTGAAWLHHYGSITQSLMKVERGLRQKDALGNRYNYRLLQQSWLERKWRKWQTVRQRRQWRATELAADGMTLHGVREGGGFQWR